MTDTGWHLDKKVPISLILAIVLQTGGVIWAVSALFERQSQTEVRVVALELADRAARANSERNATNIAVINQNLQEIHRSLARIEKKLEVTEQRNINQDRQ